MAQRLLATPPQPPPELLVLEPTRSPGTLNEAVKESLSLNLPRRPRHPNTSTPQGLPFCGRTAPARRQTLPAEAAPRAPHTPGHRTEQSPGPAPWHGARPVTGGEQVHPLCSALLLAPCRPSSCLAGVGETGSGERDPGCGAWQGATRSPLASTCCCRTEPLLPA